ncbi:MAG: TMEM165/GDT1 family protein [Clostridia bacterium]|nr:TMEM165/GDT1 family protein [Clostridia bacterium]
MVNFFTAFAMVFIAEMGDKTQLFLIGLSSKFKLRDIIIGVAAATVVLNGAAVALGYLIGNAIDPSIIKCLAGAAFLAFAYTSLFPKGEEEEGVKRSRGAVVAIFLSFLAAELGDKTQLMTLTLAAQSHSAGGGFADAAAVFAACSLGLFAADIIGMLAGYFLSKKLPEKAFGAISFVIFTAFGIYTVYEASYLLSAGNPAAVIITVAAVTVAFALLCGVTLCMLNKKKSRAGGTFENEE